MWPYCHIWTHHLHTCFEKRCESREKCIYKHVCDRQKTSHKVSSVLEREFFHFTTSLKKPRVKQAWGVLPQQALNTTVRFFFRGTMEITWKNFQTSSYYESYAFQIREARSQTPNPCCLHAWFAGWIKFINEFAWRSINFAQLTELGGKEKKQRSPCVSANPFPG